MIDTTQITDRRAVRCESLADILAGADRLDKTTKLRAVGNWTPGQIVEHIAEGIRESIDGYGIRAPEHVRQRAIPRRDTLLAEGFPAGIQLPDDMQHLVPSAECG